MHTMKTIIPTIIYMYFLRRIADLTCLVRLPYVRLDSTNESARYLLTEITYSRSITLSKFSII